MTSRVDADWVVGELRGKKGMFPVSFVDKVPENLPKDSSEQKSGSAQVNSGGKQQSSSPPPPATTEKKQVNCHLGSNNDTIVPRVKAEC